MNVFGVIMAGGGGTRFWPLSRKNNPKQLLNLSSKDLMINETINRLNKVVDKNNVFIVTNATQINKMIEVTNGKVNSKNILSEPSARNTAACIGYATMKINCIDPNAIIIVSPSDAYIKDEDEYAKILEKAVDVADKTNSIVTIGIEPTFASTGYGYIHFSNDDSDYYKVVKFVEKPSQDIANEYFVSKEYLWNSGIFVWKVSTILNKFKELLPDIYEDLIKISLSFDKDNEQEVLNNIYPNIRSISIDYGVMEKSDDIYVVPGDFGWSDVGSWDMLGVLHEKDNNYNIKVGDSINIDTSNSVIYSSKKLIATIGVDNLVIVETDDAILVCNKNRVQDVKKIVDKLKEERREDLL